MGTPADDTVVRCDGVTKSFGAIRALDGLDLRIRPGVVVGYLGPNGAGKSTTIRILLDLARPDTGEVRVLGQDPRRAGAELRRRIGYLPGEIRLGGRETVGNLLTTWSHVRGGVDATHVTTLCERLDLDPTRRTDGLSTGNRRKVGLVGAFMGRPELLLLDEPTSGIDPLVQSEVMDLIADARADGATVFLSSHVLSDVQRVADRVVVIRAGRTVADGALDELRRSTRQRFTVWFRDPAPEAALAATPGVGALEVHGTQASGVVEGGVDGLLRELARHTVEHLVLPEPDLEDAFLRYYERGDA